MTVITLPSCPLYCSKGQLLSILPSTIIDHDNIADIQIEVTSLNLTTYILIPCSLSSSSLLHLLHESLCRHCFTNSTSGKWSLPTFSSGNALIHLHTYFEEDISVHVSSSSAHAHLFLYDWYGKVQRAYQDHTSLVYLG